MKSKSNIILIISDSQFCRKMKQHEDGSPRIGVRSVSYGAVPDQDQETIPIEPDVFLSFDPHGKLFLSYNVFG